MLSTPFDDLDKEFDDIANMPEDNIGPAVSNEAAAAAQREQNERFGKNKPTRVVPDSEETMFKEDCTKCRGKGYIGAYMFRENGVCYQCGGKGFKLFKKSKEDRAKARDATAARKEKKEAANLATFEAQYPQLAAWWTGSTFEFAVDLRARVMKTGSLTPGQLGSALNTAEKFAAAKAKRVEEQQAKEKAVEALPVLNVQHITDAFNRAREAGIKRPKLRLFSGAEAFEFSRAPDHGKNPGAIYVNSNGGTYLGKVMSNKFLKGRDCDVPTEQEVLKVCSDPSQAAVAYGKQYGACSICGRELSNQESIDRGIGPICADKFGF